MTAESAEFLSRGRELIMQEAGGAAFTILPGSAGLGRSQSLLEEI